MSRWWSRRRSGPGGPRRRVLLQVVASTTVLMALGGITAGTASAATRSCTIYWTGATSGDWGTASNWSLTSGGPSAGRVPRSADFVCMSTAAAHTAVVLSSSTTAVIGGINWPASSVSPRLEVDGSLTLGAAGSIYTSTINALDVQGILELHLGENATAGTLTLDGTISHTGTLTATGDTTLGTNSALGPVSPTHLILDGSTTAYGLTLTDGSKLVNRGSLTLIDGAIITGGNDPANTFYNDPGGEVTADSDDGGGDTASVAVAAVNDGLVDAAAETLQFGLGVAPAPESGTYAATGDWALSISGEQIEAAGIDYAGSGVIDVASTVIFTANAHLSNTGEIDFAFGAATIDAGVTVTANTVNLYNGNLTGPGTLVATDHLGAFEFDGEDPFSLDNGVHVVSRGASEVGGSGLDLNGGSEIENQGTLTVDTFSGIVGDAASELINDAGATLTVTYGGATVTPDNTGVVDVKTVNHGTITAPGASGDPDVILELDSLSNLSGGRLSGGTYSAAGGDTLDLGGDVVTNDASIVLGSSGSFDPADSGSSSNSELVTLSSNPGSLELGQTLALNGPLTNSGSLTLDASATLSAPSLSQSGSARLGIHISGAMTPGTDYGQLEVSGAASLNGTLALDTANGYTQSIGTTYTLITAGAISGMFASVSGQTLPDRGYVISYTPTTVTATVVSLVPTVIGISPKSGPAAGGTTVTITGSGFTHNATVTFGNDPATHVTYVSSTELTAVAPAQTASIHNVLVTTSAGTSAAVTADQYTYVAAVVTGVSPNSGPAAGETAVTITGAGFTPDATVTFGNVPATHVTDISPTTLTAVAPAQAPSTHNVFVITPAGSSAAVTADQYTYK